MTSLPDGIHEQHPRVVFTINIAEVGNATSSMVTLRGMKIVFLDLIDNVHTSECS